MTRKLEIPNLDDLIRRYQAGEPIKKLAHDLGVSPQTVTRRLQRAGVYVNRASHQRVDIPGFAAIIPRYLAGESENALARELGIGRYAFRSNLMRHGIPPRSQSDAERVKWQRMTNAQRTHQTTAAHTTMRGRPVPFDELCAQAAGVERAAADQPAAINPTERRLGNWLFYAGLPLSHQKAVGPYNLDIALHAPPIAVEIFGGNWHRAGRHRARHPQRYKYLLDLGWHVVIVWVHKTRYPLSLDAAKHIVAFAQLARSHPTAPRQYRVIRGDGQLAPRTETYLNGPSTVDALGCRFDPAGHHHMITR
jgi:very-short-patch-repair endonuclease